MTTIRRQKLEDLLLPRGSPRPGAGGARLAAPERVDADTFDRSVRPQLEGALTSPEARRPLEWVQRVLRAPSLFDPASAAGTASLQRLTAPEPEGPPPRRLGARVFDSFLSLLSRRIASGGATATTDAWSAPMQGYVQGFPVLTSDALELYVVEHTGTLVCLSTETGEERWREKIGQSGHTQPVLNPENDTLFVIEEGEQQSRLVALDLDRRDADWAVTLPGKGAVPRQASSPALSANGRELFVVDLDGHLRRFDSATGEETARIFVGPAAATQEGCPSISPDGRWALVRDGEDVVCVDLQRQAATWRHPVSASRSPAVFSLDGRTAFVAGRTHLSALDVATGRSLWTCPVETRGGHQLPVLSPDGKAVYLPDSKGALAVVDAGTGQHRLLPGSNLPLQGGVALSQDGKTAYGVDFYGGYYAFDLGAGRSRRVASAPPTHGFSLSPDGRFAYQAGNASQVIQAVPLHSP